MLADTGTALPTDDVYSRNYIGGEWVFPAAPYEFEIRNPADSTITAVVPLSSRNDVNRAIAAAQAIDKGEWADPERRVQLLMALLDRLNALEPELVKLQCGETGLSAEDSAAALRATLAVARALVFEVEGRADCRQQGASGHVLSWGLPLAEMLTSVFATLVRGMSVVVKPSLRGPLSPVAVALAATQVGFPPGSINVVQGTGVDVGAALIGSSLLDELHVHGNPGTLAQARRAEPRTGVPLRTLSAGGNVAIIYPEIDDRQISAMAAKAAVGLRIHSTGGPFGQTTVAVHDSVAPRALEALVSEVGVVSPAPLPSEPLRRVAMSRVQRLGADGGRTMVGRPIPDDIEHRMGWRMPPVVTDLGNAATAAGRLNSAGEPLGPVLTVVRWTSHDDLDQLFAGQRYRAGYASTWGEGFADDRVTFGAVARSLSPLEIACVGTLPLAWAGL